MTEATRKHQAGLTLIELMITMVIGSIVVGMVLAIYTRLSTGYAVDQSAAAHVAIRDLVAGEVNGG